MAILDARAQLVCNIGPIISGQLSDDHQQGRGVIRTTGTIVLSGLFSPEIGSVVNLAYVDASGSTLARFPRATLRVIAAYADPFTRQTTLEVGCLMSFLSNRSGRLSLVDGLYRNYLQSRSKRTFKRISGATLLGALCLSLGVTPNTLTLVGRPIYYDIEELAGESQNYVDLLDKLLNTHNHAAYINDREDLVIYPLFSELNGPRLTFDSFIDIQPTTAGEEPGSTAVTRGTYLSIPEKETRVEDVSTAANGIVQQGTAQVTNSPTQPIVTPAVPATPVTSGSLAQTASGQAPVSAPDQSKRSSSDSLRESSSTNQGQILISGETVDGLPYSHVITYGEFSKTTEAYNSDGILQSRETIDTLPLIRINTQLVEDYARVNQGALPDFALRPYQRVTKEINQYEVTQNELGENSYKLRQKKETTHVSAVEMIGAMGVPNYEWFDFNLPGGTLISQVVETTYLRNGNTTKEVRRLYRNLGATQAGQQGIGKAMQELKRPILGAQYFPTGTEYVYGYLDISPFLSRYAPLVLDSVQTQTRTEPLVDQAQLEVVQERVPYVGKTQQATTATPPPATAGAGITGGQLNSVKEFRLPLEPADEQVSPSASVQKVEIEQIAQEYAGTQNQMLYEHRLGRQFVTTLGVLPLYPYQCFHVEYNGVVATYRVNGTSFAFDQTQCLVSTDGLYAGVAGGSIGGAGWVPLPPGTTQLPAAPATVNNGAQTTANSAPLAAPINTGNQAAVNSLIASLPSGQSQGFQYTSAPAAVLPPFQVTELIESPVRLPMVVKGFASTQAQTRLVYVARIKITGVSGEPADLPLRLPIEVVSIPIAANLASVINVAPIVTSTPVAAQLTATVHSVAAVS